MRFALLTPAFAHAGSVYFGCREPHLPLGPAYAAAVLERAGHETLVLDAGLLGLSAEDVRDRVAAFAPDVTVLETAPSYLFWRCPPPDLAAPLNMARAVRKRAGLLVAVGPHASATPGAVLRKMAADAVVRGEFETVLPVFAGEWRKDPRVARLVGKTLSGGTLCAEADLDDLPALTWDPALLACHVHHHHRFDKAPDGPGAEIEASRGCPFSCSFCAKEHARGRYRKRRTSVVLEEVDGLRRAGAVYIYFIDELFLPRRDLLRELAGRGMPFGVQTRLDLWDEEDIRWLGKAGCVSVECGMEAVTDTARARLNKRLRISSAEMEERLFLAAESIPFVQANLVRAPGDDPESVQAMRDRLRGRGVWANDPVPIFAYPGSGEYRKRFGEPDDLAWERACDLYLQENTTLSDLQQASPLRLQGLESA